MQTIDTIRSGQLPEPSELLSELETYFPLIREMANTPQDREWHAEGNVRIHTEMVLDQLFSTFASNEFCLDLEQKVGLTIGAALHDIGKTKTTREEEIGGRIRITSPHHAERGCSYSAPFMGRLGLSIAEIELALGIIRFHHHPKRFVMRSVGKQKYTSLARNISPSLIYLFELCDLKGRIANDLDEQIEIVELFREEADSFGLPYSEWKQFFEQQIEDPAERNYAYRTSLLEFESGTIQSPEEGLAKTWAHRKEHPTLTMISAPSGSGKSTWIRKHLSDESVVISLDGIREQLTGKRSDQSKNGQVLQIAKQRLREGLRNKRQILWDSTALRTDLRRSIIGLARDYHAYTKIIALGVPPDLAIKQNRERKAQVPESVLQQQYQSWQWPDLTEAHEVKRHYFPEKENRGLK